MSPDYRQWRKERKTQCNQIVQSGKLVGNSKEWLLLKDSSINDISYYHVNYTFGGLDRQMN